MDEQWKPKKWIAVMLGLFLQPFTFFYVNKPRWFFVYVIPWSLAGFMDQFYQTSFNVIFLIICPIHAYRIAKTYDLDSTRNWYSRWWGIPAICSAILITILVVRVFLFEPFRFASESMSPYIDSGDKLLVRKIGFPGATIAGFRMWKSNDAAPMGLQQGEVYLFFPAQDNSPTVGRLIAKPGDSVDLKGTSVFVNGEALKATLVSEHEGYTTYEENIDDTSYRINTPGSNSIPSDLSFVVPEEHYFFLSDNRFPSIDGRTRGTIPANRLIGKVVYVFKL